MFEQPDDSDGIVDRTTRAVEAASRYDLVLAVIPLALASGALLSSASSMPTHLGVAGGGGVALAVTAYALFGDPPTGPDSGRRGARGMG